MDSEDLSLMVWRGKPLARRVWVINAGTNKFLFHVTDIRAFFLLKQRTCDVVPEPDEKRITRVMLIQTPGEIVKPPHPHALTDYQSCSTVYREKVYPQAGSEWSGHKIFSHRFISKQDAWAYRPMNS